MPPITDQELASQIKAKVAELRELKQKAEDVGLQVHYDWDYTEQDEKGNLYTCRDLKVHIARLTTF